MKLMNFIFVDVLYVANILENINRRSDIMLNIFDKFMDGFMAVGDAIIMNIE